MKKEYEFRYKADDVLKNESYLEKHEHLDKFIVLLKSFPTLIIRDIFSLNNGCECDEYGGAYDFEILFSLDKSEENELVEKLKNIKNIQFRGVLQQGCDIFHLN